MKTFSLLVLPAVLASTAVLAAPVNIPRTASESVVIRVAEVAEIAGKGTVNAVDPGAHKINLTHEPIAALGWPSMRMTFQANRDIDLKTFKAGTEVDFVLTKKGSGYEIKSIAPSAK